MPAKPPPKSAPQPRPAPWLEWTIAGLGLLLVAGSVAVLLGEALLGGDRPAAIQVRALGAERTASGWRLQVEAHNTGDATAADVQIEGLLSPPGGPHETSTLTFAYVPDGGREEGALHFKSDPRQGKLELGAKGWSAP